MNNKLIRLAKRYKEDDKALLNYNAELENLYVFSRQGRGLTENLDFTNTRKVLYIGEVNIPRLMHILENVESLVFLDLNDSKELLDVYFADNEKFRLANTLTQVSTDRYDKVFIIGALDKNRRRQVREYKALLSEGGSLVIAADNIYGLKYTLGAKRDDSALSYFDLCELVKDLNLENTSIYYPYPDYRLALSLYSDKYLPKDELANDIAAYNYPRYAVNAPGRLYEEINEKGDFAKFSDSFLLVSENKSDEIFVKYNGNRKDEFAIKTSIRDKEGALSVRKTALYESGTAHIKKLKDSYEKLCSENTKLTYLEPKISDNLLYADFEYVEGENLSLNLAKKIENGKLKKEHIQKVFDIIIGEGTINIDANFDNFIVKEGKIIGIDYEWVAEAKLEKKYSYYRALKSFYHKHSGSLKSGLKEMAEEFGINEENIKDFEAREREFQEYVHGENQQIYLDNYFVDFKDGTALEKMEKEHTHYAKNFPVIEGELRDKSMAFDRLLEMKRLSDNHIGNLDAVIANLRAENSTLAASNEVLNRHLSLTYRVYRKLRTKFEQKFPKGSSARKKFSYMKLAFTRPAYMFNLLTTAEGKNRLEGDMKIGEDYLHKGKLVFEKVENPKVSIIIPVYNQVHYTYACLASILENTKNISYEIIIADDVSSDATKELDKFAENLVIARNESNQGFLKNCNQAAKKARGEYILFLNNDTKVTDRWLDSLVCLIENDKSIGMVGSKLIYPDGRLQEAGGIIWSDGSGWNYGRLDDPDKCEYNYVKDVDYISGAAIMLSRKLWESIGGFDERFAPAYCEDSDLAFEVRKRGLRVVYQPKSVVIHFEGISNGTDVNGTGLKRYQIENSKKLKEKWAKEFSQQFENGAFPNAFRARERSKDKKIILFVDHYVPTFDKDAGSKTTYQYLKMLVSKGYVVKFLGDNFLKEEPYTSALEQLGIEVLYGKDMQAGIFEWIKKNAENIHLVYLNRPHIAANYIDFIRNNTKLKVIYYGHDLHFLREQREYELGGDKEHKANSKYWKSIELSIMRKADISYYPSQVEIDYIADIDEEIKAKAITAYVYDSFKTDIEKDFEKREGLLFVGGFAHPPNADALFWFTEKILPEIRKKLNLKFYIVGSKASKEIQDLHDESKGIIFKGFVSDEELEELYRKVRLVVVPLRYGAGVKGKVIEALYYNMPVITTSVGAEGIKDADTVMSICDSERQFADETAALYENTALLEEMSCKADKYIREHNSIEAVWSIIKEDFEY